MASGVARSRSLWRFISVDPEIYPLMGVVAATFGFSGYMLGHKASVRSPEDSVRLAKDKAFPWHADGDGEQNGDYKYKYHRSGNPEKEVIKAPAADIAHTALVDLPKDAAQKVGEKFGESKS
ncbi:hypothetical protein RclHR1_07300005 [Rhizophagus clarus]|uniref:Uncharacterized protein n=1 Tax=Rhizophagus clarus TaxID=94130 RepID=A0A2Z6S2E5_9GLOM|nr:hypothetical protein RclHR1_07300005 [Rhizophagus clarus]GES94845.1 hypothetical protein GLOIN_2v1642062 [Rhizophagus clarus]